MGKPRRNKRHIAAERRKKQHVIFGISVFILVCFVVALAIFMQPKERENVASLQETAPVTAEISSPYEIVINRSYPVEPDFIAGTGKLTQIGSFQLESEAAKACLHMMSAMEKEGLHVDIKSGYRTNADQEFLYNRQITRQGGDEIKAATVSALPLTSEHETGLAVDFTADGNLDSSFGSTKQGQWLWEHCAEYGFILRYPEDKTKVTGIIWEPWHFRYVGSPKIAAAIMDSGLVMEEYYGKTLKEEDLTIYLPYLS